MTLDEAIARVRENMSFDLPWNGALTVVVKHAELYLRAEWCSCCRELLKHPPASVKQIELALTNFLMALERRRGMRGDETEDYLGEAARDALVGDLNVDPQELEEHAP